MAAQANGTISSTHANGTANGTTPPKIHLYTNHRCPYAHRAHIALQELDLPFEETIIDLDAPRPQWYLDINPRGLVPAIKYTVPGIMDEEILYESQVVAQFLCDSFPSHLLPSSREDPSAPLRRARISFFIDAYSSKLSSFQMSIMKAPAAEKAQLCSDMVATVKKELEPLLKDANPFFGGSEKLTFAEVITAPFVLRMFAFAQDGKFVPKSLAEDLDALPNFGRWSRAVISNKSVQHIWRGQEFIDAFLKKYGKVAVPCE